MEDEETTKYNSERYDKLGFKPQKEKIYNKLLPYGNQLDDESIKLYTDIKSNLIKSIVGREFRPGIALWTSRLNNYIKLYGMKFSKEDHIALIKLYYNLLITPNLDPTRISKFACTLGLLLKKRCLISQDELQLEWKPLYDLCLRVLEKSKKELEMYNYNSKLENNLGAVIRYAKVYFPLNATQEILDEFRPFLFPYNDSDIANGTQYLELFLPVLIKPENANFGYNLWFNELMNLWETCQNGCAWENHIMWLMARLTFNNIGYIDWEPHLSLMFTRFLITLNLPVNFKKGAIKTYLKLDVSAMSVWMVSILGGPNDTGFSYLEKCMQTLESYYHPANAGMWTMKIREFLKKVSYYFVQRVYVERHKKNTWQYSMVDNYKLTEEQIDRFVNIMKPSIDLAIFSRLGYQNVSSAVQYLATLRPNIICPIVLEKLYASMDTLTEPHKLTSSIVCLNAVARYLVQGGKSNYPEGPTHVVPLLMALLPGIDPNDIRKCFMTFNFLTYFVNMVPLINSSEASKYYDDLTEEEHIICEATAGFEDFVVQLFDRLCAWIESNSQEFTRLEQTEQDNKTVTETLAESAVVSVITSILTQSSPEIFQIVLKKMYNFVTSRIFELKVSGNMVATICQAFVGINPRETMKLFMPYLCETVERLLNETDDVENEENLNQELLYNLLILTHMIEAREELVNYIDRFCNILDKTLHMKSVVGSRMGTHMLGVIMASLSIITPTEYRSLNKSYDNPIKDNLTIREWGKAGDLRNLKMSWYVPGEREINCVQKLLNKYLVPELERLNRYVNGEESLSRETLRCSLNIVISTLGSHPLLPQWNEPPLKLVDTITDTWSFNLIVGPKSNITLPDGRNVRKVVVDTMHDVQRKIMENDEGDTKSIRAIMTIYDTILFNKFKTKDFEARRKHFHVLKKYLEDRVHQEKTHLRFVLINRVLLHQLFRNESRICYFSETHRQILLDLFELGVSRYSEIRSVAQVKIATMISVFPYSYTVLVPRIKEILRMDPTEHHETFKGCLYILLNPKNNPIVTRHDWKFISELWPLIISSKPSEKLSIVNLMNTLIDSVHRNLPTLDIKLYIPESTLINAQNYGNLLPKISIERLQETIKLGLDTEESSNATRLKYYEEAVNNLLKLVTCENLHWRHYSMALGFLRDLVHPDVKYNAKVVEFFLKCLIDESIVVRKIALKAVVFIVVQNKPKFVKIKIDPYQFNNVNGKINNDNDQIKPGIRPDNKWLLYDSKTLPKNDLEWDKPRYVHNQYVGFYSWPKTLEVYAKSIDQPTPSKRIGNLTDQERTLYNYFTDDKYVDVLISYLSMEEKKGKDLFNGQRFLLFKNLFKIFEDKLLHVFLPHLQRLVDNKQEHYQRCAAEIISGMIRGSKHWNYKQVESLWTELIPLLRVALNNLATETVPDWSFCVTMGLDCRDPNRHHWLLEFLLDNPLSETSSFVSSGRLIMLKTVLQRQSWRNVELYNRLLSYFQKYMTQPFQNVREKISSCLASIFSNDLIFPDGHSEHVPRIKEFFDEITPQLNNLYEDTLKQLEHSNETNSNCKNADDKTALHIKDISLDDGQKETSIRLFKIIALYIIESISHINSSAIPEYYKLLPLACIQQSNDIDDELANISLGFLSILSHTITLSRHVPDALEAIRKVSLCPSWSARESVAEFISVFVFHNMATLITKDEWIEQIQDIVLQLVEDKQPEVRVQASRVLSDLLQCQFIPKPAALLEKYKIKAKTKLKRRDMNKGASLSLDNNNGGVRLRHAGVLGMCAFISSHPYDVPDYLPGVFSELGPHLSDPQPIPATIRKTLGDFKRTHHDNWEAHKLKFTEDELSLLSDLTVPPTYYA